MPTLCGVLGKEILVQVCPLPKGACMWKHRVDGTCAFSTSELTPSDFCARVGLEPPTEDVVQALKQEILKAVKSA